MHRIDWLARSRPSDASFVCIAVVKFHATAHLLRTCRRPPVFVEYANEITRRENLFNFLAKALMQICAKSQSLSPQTLRRVEKSALIPRGKQEAILRFAEWDVCQKMAGK